jgi:polysaccharide biosynthesis transport protein
LPPVIAGGAASVPQAIPDASKSSVVNRYIPESAGLLRYVIGAPFSQFAEALRSVKVAIDLSRAGRDNKIIGVTSSIPNEGKSTLAANLAELIAHSGARVILVDADLRNPSLSRHLARDPKVGFVDVIDGRADLGDAIWQDNESKLEFLPFAADSSKLMHTSELLSSERCRDFIARLRDVYDYVIVDLAPLAPVVDTRATSSFIDSYIYLVEWGRTEVDVVEHNLSVAREVYDRVLGVVMNKANMHALKRYEHYRSNYYYKKYYSRYGYTA